MQQASQYTASTAVVPAVPLLQVLAQSGTSITQSVGNTFTLQPGFLYRLSAGVPEVTTTQNAAGSNAYSNGYFQWLNGAGQPIGSAAVLRNTGYVSKSVGFGIATAFIAVPATSTAQVVSLQYTYVTIPGQTMTQNGGPAPTYTFIGDGTPPETGFGGDNSYYQSDTTRLWAIIENVYPFLTVGNLVATPQVLQVASGSQVTTPVGYSVGSAVTIPVPLPAVLFSSGTAISMNSTGTFFTLQPGFLYRLTAMIPESYVTAGSAAFAAGLTWLNQSLVPAGSFCTLRGCTFEKWWMAPRPPFSTFPCPLTMSPAHQIILSRSRCSFRFSMQDKPPKISSSSGQIHREMGTNIPRNLGPAQLWKWCRFLRTLCS